VRRLIVTADDFGLCEAVNEGVEIAHRDGILSTASLMVGGTAAPDAVERARRLPGLRVGLHVVVVEEDIAGSKAGHSGFKGPNGDATPPSRMVSPSSGLVLLAWLPAGLTP
jgi:YdjC-like protein